MIYILSWRCSRTRLCYGISEKRFIRSLKYRTLLEADLGHLATAKMELFITIVSC